MATSKYLVEPKALPKLNIPASSSTVTVSCIDSTTRIHLPADAILTPAIPGHKEIICPAFSYFIEHASGQKLLFDLGVRQDWENMAPFAATRVKGFGWKVEIEKNVSEILVENGVPLKEINAIIWSHHHWDHQGKPSAFPPSTDLIVGPGFKAEYTPGWPTNPDSALREDDWEGRNFREIDVRKEGGELKLGRFWALDYFGDGSFYLLDTPGHTVGHICALARTTSSGGSDSDGDTFVFLGGDACHHGGEFRPTPWLPLPASIGAELVSTPFFKLPCPGEMFQQLHHEKSATKPFYEPRKGFSHDHDTAMWTIEGVEEFDAHENVLVAIAHDGTFLGQLNMYPESSMNAWKERGERGRVLWRFLGDFDVNAEKKEE